MKNSILILAIVVLIVGIFSCEKITMTPTQTLTTTPELNNAWLNKHISQFTSIDDVKDLGLDVQFSLPNTVYETFLGGFVFYNGTIGSFPHKDINDYLANFNRQQAFWNEFGLSINPSLEFGTVEGNDCVLENHKKMRREGSCKENEKYSCYICPPSGSSPK